MLALTGCANDPPSATFDLSPNPASGQTVKFDGSASTGGRDASDQPVPIARWEWDLDGNGTFEKTTTAPAVTHTYDGTQTINASLRVVSTSGRVSPVHTRTVLTSESQTALAPASAACPTDTGDGDGCGAGFTGSPLSDSSEPVPSVRQPRTDQLPTFNAFFGGEWAAPYLDPEIPVSIAHGADRVFALDRMNDVDVHDASSLAYVREFDVDDGSRDLAFYRGEVYVLNHDGAVEVFAPDGTFQRKLRLPYGVEAALGASPRLLAENIAVSWNEVWSTFQIGDRAGQAIVVRDAKTGALKAAALHEAGSDCALVGITPEGSNWCIVESRTSGTPNAYDPTWFARGGLSAVPELSMLISHCGSISRKNLFGVTIGFDERAAGELFGRPFCEYDVDDWYYDAAHTRYEGSDAPPGMRWFVQVRKEADEFGSPIGDTVHEWSLANLQAPTSASLGGNPKPTREWTPMDSYTNNDRDIAYRARETKVDWSGVLTKDPSDWLRSPNNTEDKCLHYVVSDADIYVAGYRGERWYELARDLVEVQLIYDGAVIKTSTAAEGDFCINTRGTYNGKQIVNGARRLEVKAILHTPSRSVSAVNENLRVDNENPGGRLVEVEDIARGSVKYEGLAWDNHSGVGRWVLEATPPGQNAWREVCTPDGDPDENGRYSCTWDTANGQYPDGSWRVRSKMIDRASDGGNLGLDAREYEVDVENAGDWQGVDQDGVYDPVDGNPNDDPETEFEPATTDVDPGSFNMQAPEDEPHPQCAEDDPFLQEVAPTYVKDAGIPVGSPDPAAALVEFMSLPQVPALPIPLFRQAAATGDHVLFTATENDAVRALVEVVKVEGGWVGARLAACSNFPVDTPEVPNVVP